MQALLLSSIVIAAAGTPAGAAAVAPSPAVEVAVTIDDGPFVGDVGPGDDRQRAIRRIVAALATRRASATLFVTCRNLGNGSLLPAWQSDGITLGNHATAHKSIDDLGVAELIADARACRERLDALSSRPVRYFRFPMLQTGATIATRDAATSGIRALGHAIAPVTIDTAEWVLNPEYVRALTAKDESRRAAIGAAYVEHVLAAARHYRGLAQARLARDPRHILLLHANALAADHLGTLLDRLAAEGFRFVTLEAALADPLYAMSDRYAGRIGLSWLYRIDEAASQAWSFDRGQERALAIRFAGATLDEPLRIDADLTVRPLRDGFLVVTHEKPWPANSLVARVRDDALVLVHTPYTPAATARLLVWLRARFGPTRIVAINGHFHLDALGGNAALLEAGADVYGSDATLRMLRERGAASLAETRAAVAGDPAQAAALAAVELARPNHLFSVGQGLSLFGGAVQVLFPGKAHAPDNVVVYFPQARVLFGGCMVRADESIGNLSDADLTSWARAAERLRELPADYVIPGHGDRFSPDLIDNTVRVVGAALAREAASGP